MIRQFLLLALPALLGVALAGCGGSGGAGGAVPPPPPTLDAAAAAGLRVFSRHCASCHSQLPDVVIIGPSLHAIADHGGTRVDGQDARTYIYTAILRPDAYLVEGYENKMPSDFGKTLTGEDLDNVVAYLFTLR